MIDKWIEALRSGQYKQGKGYLKKGDCHCCLGVLCEVAGIKPELDPDREGAYKYDGQPFSLPPKLRTLFDNLDQANLINLNDAGVPFSVIADKLADPSSEVYKHDNQMA